MIAFPPAKINLGLHVLDRRSDGYHNLATLFFPYPALSDILEVVRAHGLPAAEGAPGVQLQLYGRPVPGDPAQNLCCKAWHLLNKDFGLPPTHIHLYKNIPLGAGLGGGSSDAAYCLRLLNEVYGLGLSTARLRDYGVQLGMDVPFFLQEGAPDSPLQPRLGSGRGEVLEPWELDLSAYEIRVETFPHIHLSTAAAYAALPAHRPHPLPFRVCIAQGIENWKYGLQNDFEAALASHFPEIAEGLGRLYAQGAVYAALTGSGSAIYGLFPR